jgi:type I restriction enzyme S subunit
MRRGITYDSSQLQSEEGGIAYVNMKSFLKGGGFNREGTKTYSGAYSPSDLIQANDVLIANTDVTAGDIVGVPALLPEVLKEQPTLFSHHVTRLRLSGDVHPDFVYFLLCLPEYRSQMLRIARGTTVLMLDMQALKRVPIRFPERQALQNRISEILSTVDEAIEQTEALIAKTQQIKAGLMHDLFTRGVTADGQLRPPREAAPQLYKESPLGWIPKDWDTLPLDTIADSLIDGPFGSNLKTEHYVEGGGVRVVRLQNIQEGEYSDSDKVFISNSHAANLLRHRVMPGDVLIAALGDDNYPVGRSCSYPVGLPAAINKADCFRLQCKSDLAVNAFVMWFLNTACARAQTRRYEQGVTRRRINLSNLKRVLVPVPSLEEQLAIQDAALIVVNRVSACLHELEKLNLIKRGLMYDLLTGSVPATASEPAEVAKVAANV